MRPRILLLIGLTVLLGGCKSIGFTWGPPAGYSPSAGDTERQRYVSWPGNGATDIQLVPTVQWSPDLLREDLKGLTRLVVQIATPEGRLVYRVSSIETSDPSNSWLLTAKSIRLFSRPRGTSVQADPEFATLGRLKPASTYRLLFWAEHLDKAGLSRRTFETLTFETLDLER